MNKICPRCRKVYSYSLKQCPNGCSEKARAEYNKFYDTYQRKNSEFYSSKAWKILRKICKNKYSGLCLWSLYKHKKIKKGTTAHHIVPISQDKTKALLLSNLIYVSDEAHREIHKLYELNQKETIKQIKKFIQVYELEHDGRGI